jgi:aryl carrier-like protein
MIVRFDNPLIIVYSEELDDDDLIRNGLETLKFIEFFQFLIKKFVDIAVVMNLKIKRRQIIYLGIL